MPLEPIIYTRGSLQLLNQLLLPHTTTYEHVNTAEDGAACIKEMKVRGAPAIAIAAALSAAVDLYHTAGKLHTSQDVQQYLKKKLHLLKQSRPTAVHLMQAADELMEVVDSAVLAGSSRDELCITFYDAAEKVLSDDLLNNKRIGANGVEALRQIRDGAVGSLRVLTHCNTGSLASGGWGTALGIVRTLHSTGSLEHVYCTETRPYNQGARLTAYEIVADHMPGTLICDSMAGALMAQGKVDLVVVGADRIAANGDTANKIGTYTLAVLAAYHKVPFIVAAATSTIDPKTVSGASIVIEQRPAKELTHVQGVHVAASGIDVWNPGFDVTPSELITCVVTEKGILRYGRWPQ